MSFADRPESGVTTFATLGLNGYALPMNEAGGTVRQELMMSANATFVVGTVAGFLSGLAEYVWQRERALRCGEIVGPHAPISAGSGLTYVYATNPTPFRDEFWRFEPESSPPLVLAYIIPITVTEAGMLRAHGRMWFEERLEQQNPDIWDLARTEEVLHG